MRSGDGSSSRLSSPFTPTCALLGGSKTTVTCRFPQLGHISLDSSLEIGKFGPLVATSVSSSNQISFTSTEIDGPGAFCIASSSQARNTFG